MNPLLFIPSPRDIPEVKEAIDKLKIDKLWFKYHAQDEAYEKARLWFLGHGEYTHLVIHPDDLVSNQRALDYLMEDVRRHDIVVSGWCNNTAGETDDVYTDFSFSLPPIQTAAFEPYEFAKIADILTYKTHIISVLHQGTALTFLHRRMVEQIPFRKNIPPDLGLAHDLFANGITQYIDLRARMTHLRHPYGIMVGQKQKEIIFEKDSG